jgi:hypothetical protein
MTTLSSCFLFLSLTLASQLDPLFPQSWHLHSTSTIRGGFSLTFFHSFVNSLTSLKGHLNVMDAWNFGYTGKGFDYKNVEE